MNGGVVLLDVVGILSADDRRIRAYVGHEVIDEENEDQF
jgi:hypothetical protein